MSKELLKITCRDYFHCQDQIYIQELHLSGYFSQQLGIESDFKAAGTESEKLLDSLVDEYRTGDARLIKSVAEHSLMEAYIKTIEVSAVYRQSIERLIQTFPVYISFLQWVPGFPKDIAGVILGEIDIEKSASPSALFVYCGLDVPRGDTRGRNRKTHPQVTYNEFLKDKLMGVLAETLLDSCPPYAKVYRNYKRKLIDRDGADNPDWPERRLHIASLRYMIKMFLADLYYEWCIAEGIEPTRPYAERVLGYVVESHPRDAIKREN